MTKLERHDPFKAFPPTGLTPKQHRYFLDEVWAKMDLGHLYGFPLWEKAVFTLLHRSFPELHSTFVTYSKRDDSGSATALETMQQTELVDLALDCGLATAAFPMARVQLVFARADMTEAGKAGDQFQRGGGNSGTSSTALQSRTAQAGGGAENSNNSNSKQSHSNSAISNAAAAAAASTAAAAGTARERAGQSAQNLPDAQRFGDRQVAIVLTMTQRPFRR